VHLHVDNREHFGSLVYAKDHSHNKLNPELFLAEANPSLWAKEYLHPEYNASMDMEWVRPECWDIYNVPMFSEKFCDDFVNEANHFGEWSGGTYNDNRLQGGYEPVPTKDIHFNQMDFKSTW